MRGSRCRGGRVEEGGECRECSSVEGIYNGDDADVALNRCDEECGEEEGDEDGWYDEDDDAEGVTDDWYA